jgi:hypothetical protein
VNAIGQDSLEFLKSWPQRTAENPAKENHRDLFCNKPSVALVKLCGSLWPKIEIRKLISYPGKNILKYKIGDERKTTGL